MQTNPLAMLVRTQRELAMSWLIIGSKFSTSNNALKNPFLYVATFKYTTKFNISHGLDAIENLEPFQN